MENRLLMAADLGTSLLKAGVFDLSGKKLASARHAIRSEQPGPGIFLQHGNDLMDALVQCLKETADALGEDRNRIAVIGFTGQMAGFMGVDSNWNDVTGWSCSLDTRYVPYAEEQMERFGDDFYEISGTNSPLFSSKYAWFQNEFPEEAKRIAKYLMLSGYVIGRLGAMNIEDAVIDGSLLTWTGLADVKHRTWSEKICHALGIDMKLLPRITESSEAVASLSSEYAALTGLPAGIPLVSGAGDKIAGCVGAGCLNPGEILLEDASFGAISCRVEEYRPDSARGYDLLNGHRNHTLYAHYYMPGSGITREWYVSQFYQNEGESLSDAYARMDEELARIPAGADSLFAIGMLGGTVMPLNGDLSGVFLGHTWTHTPAHFCRALSESFACAVRLAAERINAMYPQYSNRTAMKMIGGGAESPVLAQMYADAMGLPVQVMEQKDAALYGGCLLGALGIGMIQDLSEIRYPVKTVFEPREEETRKYAVLAERYQRYIGLLTPLCAEVKEPL